MKSEIYETIPQRVTAKQWNKKGDHEHVVDMVSVIAKYNCGTCGKSFHEAHGRIYSKSKGNMPVCPGDYIVLIDDDFKVMKEKEFKLKHRLVRE